MTTLSRALGTAAVLVAAGLPGSRNPGRRSPDGAFPVPAFSKATGLRHDSIPAGVTAIRQPGQQNTFAVEATEGGTKSTDAPLSRYAVVIFLSPTGDPVGTKAGARPRGEDHPVGLRWAGQPAVDPALTADRTTACPWQEFGLIG